MIVRDDFLLTSSFPCALQSQSPEKEEEQQQQRSRVSHLTYPSFLPFVSPITQTYPHQT